MLVAAATAGGGVLVLLLVVVVLLLVVPLPLCCGRGKSLLVCFHEATTATGCG